MLHGLGLDKYGFLGAETDAKVKVFNIDLPPFAKKQKAAGISVPLGLESI